MLLAVLLVVLAPFALAGLFTNLVPAVAVLVAGLLPRAPVSKGTVRLLVAALVFPLTWLAIAVWDVGAGWWPTRCATWRSRSSRCSRTPTAPAQGFWPSVFVFLSIPVLGLPGSAVRRAGVGPGPGLACLAGPCSTAGASSTPILDRRAAVADLTLRTAGAGPWLRGAAGGSGGFLRSSPRPTASAAGPGS